MNKYVVFFSFFGLKTISVKSKIRNSEKSKLLKNNKINNLNNKLKKLTLQLSYNENNSFVHNYKLLIVRFMQSSVFRVNFLDIKNKKIGNFIKNNERFGSVACDLKFNEKPEVKINFPIIPMVESIFNGCKNEFEFEFFNEIKDFLSEFLNKAYELRVKKWLLLSVEADINYCYSALNKIKNSASFEELNEKTDDLFEEINDLKQEIKALEEEMESRWSIEKSFWSIKLPFSFDFVLSFLTEDENFSMKNNYFSYKKDEKINLSFLSIDFNVKIYPDIKPSLSVSIKLLNLIFGSDFAKKDILNESLKNNFEVSKIRRKIKKNIRKASKNMQKHQILKQKTSKMIGDDKEDIKKKIEDRLKYIEQCMECSLSLVLLFEQIILYKKSNNDLILDCRMLLGEEI